MAKNTLSLALEGDVELGDFAQTIHAFERLISELTNEIGEGIAVEWDVVELAAGSASAMILGTSDSMGIVERVVSAYSIVGEAMERGEEAPYSRRVNDAARQVTEVLNGKIHAIRFETDEMMAEVTSLLPETSVKGKVYSFGTIKGTIETLAGRRTLRFILYDSLFDHAVYCYLDQDQKDLVRNLWLRKVKVSGKIGRDAGKGRPVEVRQITKIEPIEDLPKSSYKRAKGVLPWSEDDLLPEDEIRGLRNDEIF